MSDAAATLCEMRVGLKRAGYLPLPIAGKRPPMVEWQTLDATEDAIRLWSTRFPHATSTGILTRLVPTLDLDITVPDAAAAVEALVREQTDGGHVLVRFGRAPRRAIPFQTSLPFKKIVRNLVAPNGDTEQKIEFLGDGQQFVAFGIHKDTGKPYRWFGGEPGQIVRADLPSIGEVEAQRLVDDLVGLLIRQHGYQLAPQRPDKRPANGGAFTGAADWNYLVANIRLGRDLHASLRDLAAKMVTAGTGGGACVNLLRGLMRETDAPRDERWKDRYDSIPRLVDGISVKQDRQDARAPDEQLAMRRAVEIAPERISFLWPGRLARGKHTAIAGEPGDGKSQLSIFVAATISTGGEWPCGEGRAPVGNVIILSAEDGAADTVVPRLMAAGADLSRVYIVSAVLHRDGKGRRTFNLQADLVLLEQKIAEIGDVALVIIDPISSYMGKADSHKNAEVRGVLEPASEMAERLKVAILSITHFSKSGAANNTKALHRFIGSIAFVGAPRAAFAVIGDADNEGRILFLAAKNNIAVRPQGLAYRLVQMFVGPEENIVASYVTWIVSPLQSRPTMHWGRPRTAKTETRERRPRNSSRTF
jgi:hypothetical protein